MFDNHPKLQLSIRRYRSSVCLAALVIILFLINLSRHSKILTDEKKQSAMEESELLMTIELRMLRLAFLKWRTCMREELDDQQLSMDDLDPEDPQFSYLQWMINQAEKKKKKEVEEDDGEMFNTLWHKLGSYAEKCRSKTDMWHVDPETLPGTGLKYFLPTPTDIPVTFVRVGIGANVSIEKFFKKKLSPMTEFFGADPVFLENSKVYGPIGTFFPFAVGNETGLKEATLKYSSDRISAKVVNHIGITTFFKNLVRKDIVDYLVFEGDGGEYDMMSHLAKGGSLEEAGVTVCQINIEYHLPKNVVDPRKEIFRKHIYQFIRDKKYALLSATNMGNLRLFWVNTSSMECARRYLERLFANDVDLG